MSFPPDSGPTSGVTVFISHSHDNPAHVAQVRALGDRLKGEGLRVLLDQYEVNPPEGWHLWMERGLETADFVLLICTETYKRRVMRLETAGVGQGASWEGNIIYALLYGDDRPDPPVKFVPVLFAGGHSAHIPTPLLTRSRYPLKSFSPDDPEFAKLVRRLTGHDPGGEASTTRPRSLEFRVVPEGDPDAPDGYQVNLSCEGHEPAADTFDGDPWKEETTANLIAAIAAGRDDEDSLRYVGSQLWSGLFAGRVGELFRALRRQSYQDGRVFHLRLVLPRASSRSRGRRCTTRTGGSSRRSSSIASFGRGQPRPTPPRAAGGRSAGGAPGHARPVGA